MISVENCMRRNRLVSRTRSGTAVKFKIEAELKANKVFIKGIGKISAHDH